MLPASACVPARMSICALFAARRGQDVAAIRRCKRRVFKLHAEGQLAALVDTSHGFRGVGQVADAVDYMLRGGHIGKVVIPL